MKYSHKLSDAVHIMAYIEICKGQILSSGEIAKSINSNPSLVRRLMMYLTRDGLLVTRKGIAQPILAKASSEISLFDIYSAIADDHNLLHVDDKTNLNCIVGGNIQNVLQMEYTKVQSAAESEMKKISLESIIEGILVESNSSSR
ncbi:MAG: Rrf2 family transcriptional regulator [Liquorilactobacillus hordei]|uniref:Rrf2 family transcriptional regulator n=1 Tax=Liquorilactobacillus hordei TaxID=468911 RepID=UPI0039E95FD8